jgi:hypothetical protein
VIVAFRGSLSDRFQWIGNVLQQKVVVALEVLANTLRESLDGLVDDELGSTLAPSARILRKRKREDEGNEDNKGLSQWMAF